MLQEKLHTYLKADDHKNITEQIVWSQTDLQNQSINYLLGMINSSIDILKFWWH